MQKLPKISCYCCTYGRVKFLEEALQSFLIQDYPGEKELVIVNDHKDQEFVFSHPQVRVLNVKKRFSDPAAKHRLALSLCTGDIFKVWDDDDIHLPHALSSIAEGFNGGVYKTKLALVDSREDLELVMGPFHNNFAFSMRAYTPFGYYADDKTSFDMRLIEGLSVLSGKIPWDEPKFGPWYIYRKFDKTNPYNISRLDCHKADLNSRVDEALGEVEQKGRILLNPNWSKPWGLIAEAAMARKEKPKWIHEVDNSFVGLPKMNDKEIQTSHVPADEVKKT